MRSAVRICPAAPQKILKLKGFRIFCLFVILHKRRFRLLFAYYSKIDLVFLDLGKNYAQRLGPYAGFDAALFYCAEGVVSFGFNIFSKASEAS